MREFQGVALERVAGRMARDGAAVGGRARDSGALVRSWVAEGDWHHPRHEDSLAGVAFLCFAAAMVAGRLFASEGELGTARCPAPPAREPGDGLGRAKLLAGVGFLMVLYAGWLAAGGDEGQWLIWVRRPGFPEPWGYPQSAWWPLIAFGAAFLLSAVLDNAVLAFVGGMVAWVPITALVCLFCEAAGERSGSGIPWTGLHGNGCAGGRSGGMAERFSR